MRILMAPTLALGAVCILAFNQPAKAEISTNDPNFHLTHGGGHGGGGHFGRGGHFAGGHHGYGGHGHGHGWHGGHGYWGGYGGWGAFGAGVAVGALGTAVLDSGGTTAYQNTYETAPIYREDYPNCWYDEDGNYVCRQ